MIKPFMSKFKVAAVAFNARVALLQMTAYPRASAVISASSLIKGLGGMRNVKNLVKETVANNGIAAWKDLGFFDTNIARSVEDQIVNAPTTIDKIVEASMLGAEWGDKITWAMLWNATKYEVAKTTKYKEGTEEFLKARKDLFRKTIYETQVVDSLLTRSHLMRDKNTFTQNVTAFMSEPTVSYNMLLNTVSEWADDARKSGGYAKTIGRHGKEFRKIMMVHLATCLAQALIEASVDRVRHADDDDDTYAKEFIDNLLNDLSVIGKVPVFKEVLQAIKKPIGTIGNQSPMEMLCLITWKIRTTMIRRGWIPNG